MYHIILNLKGHVARKETVATYAYATVIEPRNAENYVIQESVEKCVLHSIFAGDVLDLDTVAHNAPSQNETNVTAIIISFCATETSVSHEVQKDQGISVKVAVHREVIHRHVHLAHTIRETRREANHVHPVGA
ncbi:hypothetical protein Aduo_018633 [Ancylostoma duodenale]